MQQVIEGVYTFTGLPVGRVYLIDDGGLLTLVDTSLASGVKKIAAQIEAGGRRVEDVTRILITHEHMDHIGGLPGVKKMSGAEVIASAAAKAAIERQLDVAVDRVIEDGEMVEGVLGGLQVIATPGHAPGHVSFWAAAHKLLFAGDMILNLVGLTRALPIVTPDPALNNRSIQRAAALEPEVICFGHGAPIADRAAERLRELAARVGG
jgi:glyoxylase-like metal-dependent hydrolase (beta-lactamase superfamily II)